MRPLTVLQKQNEEDFDILLLAKLCNDVTSTQLVSLKAAAKFLGIGKSSLLNERKRKYKTFTYEESVRGWLMQVGELVRYRSYIEIVRS